MRIMSVRLLASIAILTLATTGAASARLGSGEQCAAEKIKATAKKTAAKLVCYDRAQLKHLAVDPACLTKADTAFAVTFQNAEAKNGCFTDGDSPTVESDLTPANTAS